MVLADGRLLKTGFGSFETPRVTHLYPYGVGRSLDGLCTQSGLGIVTRMGIWLMPAPEAYSLFVCSLERDEEIAAFVEDLRPLRLDGTVRSVVHMGNDLRVISSGMSYPRQHLEQTFQEAARVLKPSGGLYVSDFGRLKSTRSVDYFAYQHQDRQPELFTDSHH